jgi:hypothetical protein
MAGMSICTYIGIIVLVVFSKIRSGAICRKHALS